MSIIITAAEVDEVRDHRVKQGELLSQSDEALVIEAMHGLLETKREAFRCVTAEFRRSAPSVKFTERDFGIPQIVALLDRLGEEVETQVASA